MEPRTKEQKKVLSMSRHLRHASEREEKWLKKSLYEPDVIVGPTQWWCTECGYHDKDTSGVIVNYHDKDKSEKHKCPNCGAMLSRKHAYHQNRDYWTREFRYAGIMTTNKGYQVIRYFQVERFGRWKLGTRISVSEVAQFWISPNGKLTYMSKPMSGMGYNKIYSVSSPMEVRKNADYSWGSGLKIYRVIPELIRNGFTGDFYGFSPAKVIHTILCSNYAETLLKCNQMSAFRRFLKEGVPERQEQVRICLRHRYIIQDFITWNDYIGLLEQFGKDTHNPAYVCPKDLRAEHDRYVEKRLRKQREEQKRKELESIERSEEDYRRMKAKFIGISFTDGMVTVSVIPSVMEVFIEGEVMHHCVFAGEYYKRDDSLLLSARDREGTRLETVEVSLRDFSIRQSRGLCNSSTEWHDEIVGLVMKNMDLIRRAARPKVS